MSKNKTLNELTTLLAISLRHKIGSIVNSNEIYAQKYSKDADILLDEAKKTLARENWNSQDKQEIKEELKTKLRKELESRAFIDNKKFDLINSQVEDTLTKLNLN